MSVENMNKTGLVLYFAYGSNMNPERMRERGAAFYSRTNLIFPGYRLVFNKIVKTPDAGAANIVRDEKAYVQGVLYLVTLRGIYNLDKFEHYPDEYDRVSLSHVVNDNSKQEFYTYIAQPDKTREGLMPLSSYLDHLLAGRDLLTEDYCNFLKEIKTLD
ncbi:MAG: gamma-glutamylcyclotransferase family protein [Thermodesulfobacteriota bacterium]